MLSGAGGQGFRCLVFQEKVAPYPASIVWEGTTMIEEFGTCVNATGFPIGPKDMKCKSGDGQCAALDEGAKCKVEAMESGEWPRTSTAPSSRSSTTAPTRASRRR